MLCDIENDARKPYFTRFLICDTCDNVDICFDVQRHLPRDQLTKITGARTSGVEDDMCYAQ